MTIMLKKIFSTIGYIIAVLAGLIGLLLLIMGIVETIPSMWICGIVFTALSIWGGIYCGKRVPKVKQHAKQSSVEPSHASNISHCIICEREIKGTVHPKAFGGYVCRKCTGILSKNGISFWKLNQYTLTQLKRYCGVTKQITNPILLDDNITQSEKLHLLTLKNPQIALQSGEVCYYEDEATAYYEKNVVTGRKSSGAGISFRVAKGVYVRTGSGDSQVIRENIGEYFDGTLFITNFRIVLLAPKYGFDIPFSKITQIENHCDGFQIYEGAKCHSLLTIDVLTILVILELIKIVNNGQLSSSPKSYSTSSKSTSIEPELKDLRELKKLFDEGIITEEEFNAKKKQILGL